MEYRAPKNPRNPLLGRAPCGDDVKNKEPISLHPLKIKQLFEIAQTLHPLVPVACH
jgi:hypothetical protein